MRQVTQTCRIIIYIPTLKNSSFANISNLHNQYNWHFHHVTPFVLSSYLFVILFVCRRSLSLLRSFQLYAEDCDCRPLSV